LSLKNTDISKVKRLSLKEVKLPAPELRAEPTKIDRPTTAEEIALTFIKSKAPKIESLVDSFGLELEPAEESLKQPAKEFIDWSSRIEKLESFFISLEAPERPIQLNKGATITDLKKFVESHLAPVKANNGNRAFLPYLERLEKVQKIISVI
jgi:hypothetical protein